MNWTDFYRRNDFLPEPVIHATALCVADKIYDPIYGEEMSINKREFMYIVIFINFLCLIICMFFFWFLEVRTKSYIEAFDKRNVEMRDFTIRCGNIPCDLSFDYKDLLLKA
jgi:hypothetical protein